MTTMRIVHFTDRNQIHMVEINKKIFVAHNLFWHTDKKFYKPVNVMEFPLKLH